MKNTIPECLSSLSTRRKIFHSEADFQFEYAWEFRDRGIATRLEVPLKGVGEVDLLVPSQKEVKTDLIIEFKYKTTKLLCQQGSEAFALKQHGAQPLGRYDVLKDVERIQNSGKPGFVIFLTNDPLYWTAGNRGNGAAFSLQQGRLIQGALGWVDNSNTNSIGVTRVNPIKINGSYLCDWKNFSKPSNSQFKYLLFDINNNSNNHGQTSHSKL